MSNIFIIEFAKLAAFTLVLIVIIYWFQAKYEKTANQFNLQENDLIHHKKSYSKNRAEICPLYPSGLNGVFDLDVYTLPTMYELNKSIKNLENGGFFKPKNCFQREKLAIIIPYRDRETNLVLLLKYLHPLLQNQLRYYRIILIEQHGNDIFNKGRIMNIAVKEALKIDDFDCFIFHDVDLIPENDMNIYECYSEPRHLSPAVDELRYNLMYFNLVGGVFALNLEQLNRTNGYSNLYWGWGNFKFLTYLNISLIKYKSYKGAEDDDMSMRVLDAGYKITRPTNKIGRYKMILHNKRSRALNRFELLDYWKRYPQDGISSLSNLNYSILSIKNDYLYTNITVDIGPSLKETIEKSKIKKSNFKFY